MDDGAWPVSLHAVDPTTHTPDPKLNGPPPLRRAGAEH